MMDFLVVSLDNLRSWNLKKRRKKIHEYKKPKYFS
jgi:hypothetical protein